MIAELVLLSTMTWQVTSYRSVPEQTDDTPYNTSIGLHVRKGFCAVSRDVLGNSVNYGDVLFVHVPEKPELDRYCFVADTMNKRHKKAVDFWVGTWAEEHKIGVQRGYVYKLNKTNTAKRLNSLIPVIQRTQNLINEPKGIYELQKSH